MLDKVIMYYYRVNMKMKKINKIESLFLLLMNFIRFKNFFFIVGCFESRGW